MFVSEANSDRVLLNDVNVLTLHHGQSTKARRSSPVPQVSLCTLLMIQLNLHTELYNLNVICQFLLKKICFSYNLFIS